MLPVILGNAQVIESYFELLKPIDLSKLCNHVNNITIVANNLEDIDKTNVNNNSLIEIENAKNILRFALSEVDEQIAHILGRTIRKRGIANGIESAWKFITGNLDATDGERYDKAIEMLTNNQEKIIHNVEEHISLTLDAINKFENQIALLDKNQLIIEQKLESIKDKFNNIISLHVIYVHLNLQVEIVRSILRDIQTSITFAKLNVMHPTILHPNELLNELKQIKMIKNAPTLPYDVDEDNIRTYENIIDIEAYVKDKIVTFILKIPIVDNVRYTYYHLYSIPTYNQKKYQILTPYTKYLLLSDREYITENQECRIARPREYICNSAMSREINSRSPCEVQILHTTNPEMNMCNATEVTVSAMKIQQVQSNVWVIINPNEEAAHKICYGIKQVQPLFKVSLVTIKGKCSVQIGSHILSPTTEAISQTDISFPVMKPIRFNQVKEMTMVNLDHVDLDEMRSNVLQMEGVKKHLEEIQSPIVSINTSYWTIIVYIILVLMGLFFIWKYCTKLGFKKKMKPNKKVEDVPIPMEVDIVN